MKKDFIPITHEKVLKKTISPCTETVHIIVSVSIILNTAKLGTSEQSDTPPSQRGLDLNYEEMTLCSKLIGCISGKTQQTSKSWGLGPLPASDPRDGLIPSLMSSRLKGPDCMGQLLKQYINYTRGAAPCCLSLLWGMKAGTGWDQERVMEYTDWKKNVKRQAEVDRKWAQYCQRALSPPHPDICFILYYTPLRQTCSLFSRLLQDLFICYDKILGSLL